MRLSPGRSRGYVALWLLGILCVAAAVRVAYALPGPVPEGVGPADSARYELAAARIADGGSYRFPIGADHDEGDEAYRAYLRRPANAHVMPAYPYLVAGLRGWLGSVEATRTGLVWLQNLVGLVSVWIAFVLGRTVGGVRVGLLSALLVALYLPLAWISNAVMTEALFTLLLLLLVLTTLNAVRLPGYGRVIVAGLVLAASAYLRPTVVLWPFAAWGVALWVGLRNGSGLRPARAAVGAVMQMAVLTLALAPWIARNASLYKRFVPLTSAGPIPGLEYTLAALGRELPDNITMAEGLSDLEIASRAADLHARVLAEASWGERARIALLRVWDSGWALLRPYDIGSHYTGITTLGGWLAAPWLLAPHVVLVGLGGAGAWLNRSRVEHMILATVPAYFLAVHLLTYPSSRYMLPAMSIVCILAASGAVDLFDRWRGARARAAEDDVHFDATTNVG